MLRNCTAARYAINKSRMVRVAEYSRDALPTLRADTGIAYDERTQGTLQLFRTQKQLDGSARTSRCSSSYGVPYELLDRDGCIAVEPAWPACATRFVGGLRLPNDETGDCFKFTRRWPKMAEALGVDFRYGVDDRAVSTPKATASPAS